MTHNEIATMAFETVEKPLKISRVPTWMTHRFLAILKFFVSVKTYGPIEFFMTVLSIDLVAPPYGKHHLRDFFLAQKNIITHRTKAACEKNQKRS